MLIWICGSSGFDSTDFGQNDDESNDDPEELDEEDDKLDEEDDELDEDDEDPDDDDEDPEEEDDEPDDEDDELDEEDDEPDDDDEDPEEEDDEPDDEEEPNQDDDKPVKNDDDSDLFAINLFLRVSLGIEVLVTTGMSVECFEVLSSPILLSTWDSTSSKSEPLSDSEDESLHRNPPSCNLAQFFKHVTKVCRLLASSVSNVKTNNHRPLLNYISSL